MSSTTQTLKQLRARWGAKVPQFGPPPEAIEVAGMSAEIWLRCDDGTRGDDTRYSLEREFKGVEA